MGGLTDATNVIDASTLQLAIITALGMGMHLGRPKRHVWGCQGLSRAGLGSHETVEVDWHGGGMAQAGEYGATV